MGDIRVKFKPKGRRDGLFAIDTLVNGDSVGFLHWIEVTDGTMCRTSNPDMVRLPMSLDQAQATCNWLEVEYREGRIK